MISHSDIYKRVESWKQSLVQKIQSKSLDSEALRGIQIALTEFEKAFEGISLQDGVWEVSIGHPHPHPRSRSYRAEPHGWAVQDAQSRDVLGQIETFKKNATKASAVVFDLDGTLFDVSHRTLGILRKWLVSAEGSQLESKLRTRIGKISLDHIGYSLAHAFENAGLDLRDHATCGAYLQAEKFWRQKFFDGKTLVDFDVPTQGALNFVNRIQAIGAKVFYLTGRDEKSMLKGTLEQLQKHKFPTEDCGFLLKKSSAQDDQEFKKEAFLQISSDYHVIGNFENEYVNLREMCLAEKNCAHTILDSQHSGRPVEALNFQVFRLADFC